MVVCWVDEQCVLATKRVARLKCIPLGLISGSTGKIYHLFGNDKLKGTSRPAAGRFTLMHGLLAALSCLLSTGPDVPCNRLGDSVSRVPGVARACKHKNERDHVVQKWTTI